MTAIPSPISPDTAAEFARAVELTARQLDGGALGAWMNVAWLCSDVRWVHVKNGGFFGASTPRERYRVLASAALGRSRDYGNYLELHGRMVSAAYRALAFVLFRAARWQPVNLTAVAPESPADPDRAWAHRDSGE